MAGPGPGLASQLLRLVEDMGHWPRVLAEGYTSFIPNPGEEGPWAPTC